MDIREKQYFRVVVINFGKSIASSFLLVLFFSYTFNGILTYADYFANKSFIADVLCVNKDNKEMHCEGHCYLEKQLEKENENPSAPNTTKKINDIQLFSETTNEFSPTNSVLELQNKKTRYYVFPIANSYLSSIFRPPCV